MKRCWDEQEPIEHWTLFAAEQPLLGNRTDRGRIGVAVLLKFFRINARFPRRHGDVPGPGLAFVGEQLAVPPAAWFDYDLTGRSSKRDREEIRAFLGVRPITVADEEQLLAWLAREAVPVDQDLRHLRAVVADWCRDRHLEPPADERVERLIAAAQGHRHAAAPSARARPRREDDLPVPLPGRRGVAPRGAGGLECRGELERRQQLHLLR